MNEIDMDQTAFLPLQTSTFEFVETFFGEGALGVTLRRRPQDGIVYIHEIVANSQAVSLDVAVNDELWAVGESEIGSTPLDKEAWNGLITFIKHSARPLRFLWRRQVSAAKESISSKPDLSTSSQYLNASRAALTELERLVSRFSGKDKETYKKLFMVDPAQILREGRQVLMQGELLTECRLTTIGRSSSSMSGMWTRNGGSSRRFVILCNDLFVVAVMLNGNMLALEFILEIKTCKLRSLGQCCAGHHGGTLDASKNNILRTFEIIFPGGDLHFICETIPVKDMWVLQIYGALCATVEDKDRTFGWRHQFMLGTMHSAVILRDEERVRELITLFEAGELDFTLIDFPDEDGYTPLHYACILRLRSMVKILHEASADVTATDNLGLTPLHWAALQLDDYSLSLLCSHVFNIDLADKRNRTPLVIACIEGRDISGRTDPKLLQKCIESMLPYKPDLHFTDDKNQSLLHYLSASWQYEALEVLLEAGCPCVNSVDCRYFMTPLHYAANAVSIKSAVGDAFYIMNGTFVGESMDMVFEELNTPHGSDTINILLNYGARPNCKDVQGRTPLMILLENGMEERWSKEGLERAIAILLSHGARIDDVTNPVQTPDASVNNTLRTKFPGLLCSEFIEKWNMLPSLDCDKLKIGLGHFEFASEDASKKNISAPSVCCNLCSVNFTLFRRQHRCRLCNTSSCDDCSKKKVLVDSAQVRCCDGCYNRVLLQQKKFNQHELNEKLSEPPLAKKFTYGESDNNSAMKKTQLFSSSSRIESKNSGSQGVLNTNNVVNETLEQLQRRGEKLSQLNDRSANLSNQAGEFARMAKQLNQQQKSWWF